MKIVSTLMPFNFAGYLCHLISYQYSHGHVFGFQNFKTKHIISVGKGPNLICLYNIKLDDSRFNEPYNPSLSIYILNTMGETKHSISKWSFEQIGMIGKYCLMRDECVWIIKFHCVHFNTKFLALHKVYTMTFSKHAASHYFTIIEK